MTADELYQQAFRSEIAALGPQSLCDVGCAAGGLVAHAQALGIFAAGVDPDERRVAEGCAAGLDLRRAGGEALPFPDGSFDLVTFENSLHHASEIAQALAEAMRVARRAIVIIDHWFDLTIPSQAVGDRFERWLKKLDRMTGMVHWDPIPAGQIIDACGGGPTLAIAVRHMLHLTPLTRAGFEQLANRALPSMGTPEFSAAYEAGGMDREISSIRADFAHTGITEAGALLMTIAK
jgi:SAM-dependent methyltransferase